MKIRNGFVSNSSSSSFIVSSFKKEKAERQGLGLINIGKIREVLEKYDKLKKELEKLEEQVKEALSELGAEYWTCGGYSLDISLDDLKGLKDEDFISKPFDRDYAYRMNIDYPIFQSDL